MLYLNPERLARMRLRTLAVIAMLLGAVVLSIGVFTVTHRSNLPESASSVAEALPNETSEIRPRLVHTVAVGSDGSETSASPEEPQIFVQGRPVAQADIDRARANLERGLRDLLAKPTQGPSGAPDSEIWTGSVANNSEPSQISKVVIRWPQQDNTSAKLAKDIARYFGENGWTNTELQPTATPVRQTEVRHPGADASSQAELVKSELANWLEAEGRSGRVVLARSDALENSIEVWIPTSSKLGRAPVQGRRSEQASGVSKSKH